jgi:hypothetical protein
VGSRRQAGRFKIRLGLGEIERYGERQRDRETELTIKILSKAGEPK